MDSEATILERIADLAAIAQPPYEKVLLDAAQEIERLRQRECEAIKVIEAFLVLIASMAGMTSMMMQCAKRES